ncbi:hypothetical protein SELMODRAFT_106067 [Selaginella moellendorffii]|uniref:AB hydrolase-1 domain-containing protein n=1 Tax=Selaginella moellendorffii TaxID=88036 RepID=D8S0V0_SELML|nr:hypothetical protein SELMODRAFT_106067 [Selaginella moellendorffii]
MMESGRRVVVTLFFMLAMLGSLMVSSGPLFVSVTDITVLLLSAMLGCSSCLFSLSEWRAYSFRSSVIDIPLLSLIRSVIIICKCAYSLCSSPSSYRPYFGITVICGVSTAIFLTAKAALFSFGVPPTVLEEVQHMRNSWALPFLFLSSMAFGLAHIIMAHRARYQASRKLLFRWEDEEASLTSELRYLLQATVDKKHLKSLKKLSKMSQLLDGKYHKRRGSDLPASSLADADSLFMDCNNVLVHYKLVEGHGNYQRRGPREHDTSPKDVGSTGRYPVEQVLSGCDNILGGGSAESGNGKNGVILIHGFGGGVFSWRHVMNPLARQTRSTVVAFDRPGWGLTSRPSRSEWQQKRIPNPYELKSQVDLLFSFCDRLLLRSVVLVGHDDGGLLALMAAAKASKTNKVAVQVAVKGVVLVGVSLSREVVPSFTRILLHTSLGRQMLRPLLRSEIGHVTNRRAWHDASKLTADVLELYKAPLRVEGWDQALAEVTRSSVACTARAAAELLQTVEDLPALLVAGLHDMLVPLKAAQSLATKLPQSKFITIPGCGHLPPEECPGALLAAMLPFILSIFDAKDPL